MRVLFLLGLLSGLAHCTRAGFGLPDALLADGPIDTALPADGPTDTSAQEARTDGPGHDTLLPGVGWPTVKADIEAVTKQNPVGKESIATLGTGVSNTTGLVLAPDGSVYASPFKARYVIRLEPNTQKITSIDVGRTGTWGGGVLAPNGLIYMLPREPTAGDILRIDFTTQKVTRFGTVAGGYEGGVVAPSGTIYAAPFYGTEVIKIDTSTDTVTTFDVGGTGWSGVVLAPNGSIYAIPSGATTVLKIDPGSDKATTLGSLPTGVFKYRGGVLHPSGVIYGVPFHSKTLLKIDTNTDTVVTKGTVPAGSSMGGVLAPNGMIYAMAVYANNPVLRIDPATDTSTTIPSVGGCVGAILAMDGAVYGGPWLGTGKLLKIDVGTKVNFSKQTLLSPYVDKF